MRDDTQTKPTVLVVDDQSVNNVILAKTLEDDYTVIEATSGEDALRLAGQGGLDMILLDVLMPDMDGFEVCRALKADAGTRRIPVIFVTAMDDKVNEEHGLKVGAVDYIYKPISPAVVKVRVGLHLRVQQQREFLERLLEIRTEDLKKAQREARGLLGLITR